VAACGSRNSSSPRSATPASGPRGAPGPAHLPARTFYTTSGNEEAALALHDLGYREVDARGLSSYHQSAVMELLGVKVARARQQRHHDKTRNKTTWVAERALTEAQRAALGEARGLVCRAVGAFALDRVRVYSDSEEMS